MKRLGMNKIPSTLSSAQNANWKAVNVFDSDDGTIIAKTVINVCCEGEKPGARAGLRLGFMFGSGGKQTDMRHGHVSRENPNPITILQFPP